MNTPFGVANVMKGAGLIEHCPAQPSVANYEDNGS